MKRSYWIIGGVGCAAVACVCLIVAASLVTIRLDVWTKLITSGLPEIAVVQTPIPVPQNATRQSPAAEPLRAGRTWGQPSAKVTIDEWSDLQ